MNLNTRGMKVHWRKKNYSNLARPIAQFTLWMACHDRLAMKTCLFNFGMRNDVQCCFCSKPETVQHLFFGCEELKVVWQSVFDRL